MPAPGKFVATVELGLNDQFSSPMARLAARAFDPLIKAAKAANKKAFSAENMKAWGRQATSMWDPYRKASERATKMFAKAANLKQAGDGIKQFSDGVSGLIQKPIKTFMGFEKQMSSVKSNMFSDADTVESRAAMAAVAKEARRLGAETQFSATEAAEGMDILAKTFKDGPSKAADVMKAMPGILDVAAAGTVSIAEASDVASAAMNQFHLEAADMTTIGDVLVKTANSSATGISDIGEALKNAGPAAAGAGLSLQKTTALIGALGNSAIKGGEAGTALKAMILRLQAPNPKAKSALDFLGINTKDKKGNLRPIEELLAEIDAALTKKLKGKDQGARRAAILKGIFEDEAFSAAQVLTAQAGSGELAKIIASNYAAAGTAHKTAVVMGDNAAGAMANYESAVEELQLTIGEKLIPRVTELFKWGDKTVTALAAWAKENPVLVTTLGYTAGIVGVLGTALWGIVSVMGAYTTTVGALVTAKGGLLTAIGALVKGFNILKLAALSNPVTAIIVGIATAALLIYEYWDPISGFFANLWGGVTATFEAATDWIFKKIEWAGEKVRHLGDALTGTESYSNGEAASGAAKLRGMSEGELQQLASAGGAVGDQARQTLILKRKTAAEAPALLNAASNAVARVGAAIPSFGGPLATGAPLPLPAEGARQEFAGDLKITVEGEGKVTGATLKTRGNANFATRMNTGTQG